MPEAIEVLPMNPFEKCPYCECTFLTKPDREKHIDKFGREQHEETFKRFHRKIDAGNEEESGQIVWSKSKYGNGEITIAENDTRLTRSIEQQGEVRMGMYRYTLSNDKKWIIRKIVSE